MDTDRSKVEAEVGRCLPSIHRWAHGRLPAAVRGSLDTADLVQDVALRVLSKRDVFTVRHPFAVQAYMRRAFTNRVRDEIRRMARRPAAVELSDEYELPSRDATPLDVLLKHDARACYRRALARLRPKDRALVVARVECEKSPREIEREFGFPSIGAAGVAVSRAIGRLAGEMASLKATAEVESPCQSSK